MGFIKDASGELVKQNANRLLDFLFPKVSMKIRAFDMYAQEKEGTDFSDTSKVDDEWLSRFFGLLQLESIDIKSRPPSYVRYAYLFYGDGSVGRDSPRFRCCHRKSVVY